MKQHYEIMTACWRYMKKYIPVLDTDEYWAAAIADGEALSARYGVFAGQITRDILSELDRMAKEEKEKK